jgi:hypothetical protein
VDVLFLLKDPKDIKYPLFGFGEGYSLVDD